MSGEFNFIFNNVNGELVYKATDSTFNDIYENKEDPWDQSNLENPYYKISRDKLAKFLINHCHGSSYLEIGCGNGFSTQYLNNRIYGSFSGCDISPVAIDQAKSKKYDIEFFTHNIKNKINNKTYDCIIFSDLLWYILNDLDECINNAFESLNKNGNIVFYNAFLETQKYGKDIINGFNGLLEFLNNKYRVKFTYKSRMIDHRYLGIIVFTKNE